MMAEVAVVVALVFLPLDVPSQCEQPTFARVNPGLCSSPFPDFNVPPGGGGGGDGGIIGAIGRALHGLTGGLL